MSYKKAENLMPTGLIKLIQQYIDGEYLYIPRKTDNKKSWGTYTNTKRELALRNSNIYADCLIGLSVEQLAEKYYLSDKSIQRIIMQEKRKNV